jgi:hypothetical protein
VRRDDEGRLICNVDVNSYQVTRRRIQKDINIHTHGRYNFRLNNSDVMEKIKVAIRC